MKARDYAHNPSAVSRPARPHAGSRQRKGVSVVPSIRVRRANSVLRGGFLNGSVQIQLEKTYVLESSCFVIRRSRVRFGSRHAAGQREAIRQTPIHLRDNDESEAGRRAGAVAGWEVGGFLRAGCEPGGEQEKSHLWIVPAAGGEARRLNPSRRTRRSGRGFRPMAKRLMFTSKATDPTQIWIVGFDAAAGKSGASRDR